MRLAAEGADSFVTSAEVLQEILHRYLALGRRSAGVGLVRQLATLMEGRIEPVLAEDVASAAALADRYPALTARDLLHLATMRRLETSAMVSADSGFDGFSGIRRLDPANVDSWATELGLPLS
jgi:predicted nucleic acid-binding protein